MSQYEIVLTAEFRLETKLKDGTPVLIRMYEPDDIDDVREGVMASRIAAHAADIVKGVKGAAERDRKMAVARKSLDWEEQAKHSLDPARSRHVHHERGTKSTACSMCGQYCAMDLVAKYLGVKAAKC